MESKSSTAMKGPRILECTIRDGSYAASFGVAEVREIVGRLDQAGFVEIEVGHGLGLGCFRNNPNKFPLPDSEAIGAAIEVRRASQIGVFYIPGVGTLDDICHAVDLGIDFIRIGQTPANWRQAVDAIELAKDKSLRVYFNFMKSYICNPFELALYAKEVCSCPVDGLYLVDSAGGMTPSLVGNYLDLLRENTTCELGFHGHNNLGLAHANNLMALTRGATLVDTTLAGLGRGGGNAATEAMVLLMQREGHLTDVDTEAVLALKDDFVADRQDSLLPTVIDLVSGIAQFHSGFLEMFSSVAHQYGVDLKKLILRVSAVDRENPSAALVDSIARELSESDHAQLTTLVHESHRV